VQSHGWKTAGEEIEDGKAEGLGTMSLTKLNSLRETKRIALLAVFMQEYLSYNYMNLMTRKEDNRVYAGIFEL